MRLFLKDYITCFSELYVQSFSVIDLYRIACEVCMNFEQSIPANSFSKVFVPGVGYKIFFTSQHPVAACMCVTHVLYYSFKQMSSLHCTQVTLQ